MPNPLHKTLQGVIFDLDGTLVDSDDADARAWADALKEYGFPMPLDQVRKLVGMGADNLLPRAIGVDGKSDLGRQIDRQRAMVLKDVYYETIDPYPEARALVERIRESGLKTVLASSSTEDEVTALLPFLGTHAEKLIDVRTSSNDAERSKPSPDIVEAALQRAGLSADECIMIGDTPYDITAAQAVGVPIIALRCGGWPDGDLEGAIAIYNDPADLLSHYQESPLARREPELARVAGQEIDERKAGAHASG